MNFLLSAIVGMLAVELFLRMPVIAHSKMLLKIVAKSSAVVTSSRISDHWKEQVVKAYAGQIALLTLKIASMFLALGVILYVPIYVLDSALADRRCFRSEKVHALPWRGAASESGRGAIVNDASDRLERGGRPYKDRG